MIFSNGKVCSHRTGEDILRNGKYNCKQRCICRSCRRTFIEFTNYATYKSKKFLDKWMINLKE